jgi:hypothetical protein
MSSAIRNLLKHDSHPFYLQVIENFGKNEFMPNTSFFTLYVQK